MELLSHLFVAIITASAALFFLSWSIFKSDSRARPLFIRLFLVDSLLLVPLSTQLVEIAYGSAPVWLYFIQHIAYPLAMAIGYVAIDELLSNNHYTIAEILQRRPVQLTLVLIGITAAIELVAGTSGTANQTRLFRRDWAFLVPALLFYSAMTITPASLMWLVSRNIREYRDPTFVARRMLGMLGFGLTLLGPVLGIVNLGLYLIGSPLMLVIEAFVNNYLQSIAFIILMVAFVLPTPAFHYVAGWLVYWIEHRQRREEDAIALLHHELVQIAPKVQLVEDPPLVRMLTEISEARSLLWSHIPHAQQPQPSEEARLIRKLRRRGEVLEAPGTHQPQVVTQDVFRYNLAVARQLRRHHFQ